MAGTTVEQAVTPLRLTVRALSGTAVLGPLDLDPEAPAKLLLHLVADAVSQPSGSIRLVHGCRELHFEEKLEALGLPNAAELSLVLCSPRSTPLTMKPARPGLYVAELNNHRVTFWPPCQDGEEPRQREGRLVAGGRGRGSLPTQLAGPRAVAVGPDGGVYVACAGDHSVTKWPPPGSIHAVEGKVVAGGRGRGEKPSQLDTPLGLWVDASGILYIAEAGNDRITRWPPGAEEGEVLIGGRGQGSLCEPCGVVLDQQGFLYVAEAGADRVTCLAPGATEGMLVAGGQGRGDGPDQLAGPRGLALDSKGDLLVVEAENERVTRWTRGCARGEVVVGGKGSLPTLGDPSGIWASPTGEIFLPEASAHRVTCWQPGSLQGLVLAGGEGRGDKPHQLSGPCSVFVVS